MRKIAGSVRRSFAGMHKLIFNASDGQGLVVSGQWGRVELLGDRDREEFLPVVETLARFTPAPLTDVKTSPELVVVMQSSPDEFSRGTFEDLFRKNPLAQFLCVYGPWCDGDGRNREEWPASMRVPVWRATTRISRTTSPIAGLPLTATRDEIFRHEFGGCAVSRKIRGEVRIDTADRALEKMLIDALGGEASIPDQSEPWILFDVDPWTERRREELMRRVESHPCRVLPLLGFPEPGLSRELREMGIARSWAKLSPLAELLDVLDEAE